MAIISRASLGDPEIGSELVTGQCRALLGWNHDEDTTRGLEKGKIWCWTSKCKRGGEKLQVFDQKFNRSPQAGEIRDCGVANFTMVRMFHHYFAHGGHLPRDMNSKDKRRCREVYKSLIRKPRIQYGLPVDDDVDNPIQPKRFRGRARARRRRARNLELPNVAAEEALRGGSIDDPMFVEDDGQGRQDDFRDSGVRMDTEEPQIDLEEQIGGFGDAGRMVVVLD